MLSAVVAVYVVFAGVRTRFEAVRGVYSLLFGSVGLIIACGLIANAVGTGPTIAGMRYALRAVPFFLLAAVYHIRNRNWSQLKLLTGSDSTATALAVYQRYALLQQGPDSQVTTSTAP